MIRRFNQLHLKTQLHIAFSVVILVLISVNFLFFISRLEREEMDEYISLTLSALGNFSTLNVQHLILHDHIELTRNLNNFKFLNGTRQIYVRDKSNQIIAFRSASLETRDTDFSSINFQPLSGFESADNIGENQTILRAKKYREPLFLFRISIISFFYQS